MSVKTETFHSRIESGRGHCVGSPQTTSLGSGTSQGFTSALTDVLTTGSDSAPSTRVLGGDRGSKSTKVLASLRVCEFHMQ